MAWLIAGVVLLIVLLLYQRRDRHYRIPRRLATIRRAIANDSDIWMIYFTFSRRRFSEHTITPVKIKEGIYLDAIDHRRHEIRTFKISRIKKLDEIPRQ